MIYLLVGFAGALISALMASSRGRSAVGWAVAGFLLPLIAIVALALAGHVTERDTHRH